MPCLMRLLVCSLLSVVGVQGFYLYPTIHAGKSALKTSSSDYSVSDQQRRDLLVASTATTFAAMLFLGHTQAQSASKLETTSTKTLSLLENVDQALEYIDAECDRRFLHAVVASDYQLLYKGLSSAQNQIALSSAPDNLLQSSSDDAPLFRTLEEAMQPQPLQPSTSRIAVANAVAAQRMGATVCSIWPLGPNVHFAWLEHGTSFRGTWDTEMIVDGVDCGRMSLEDALESNKEILFRSERYLAVPLSMEQELVQKLKNSFII